MIDNYNFDNANLEGDKEAVIIPNPPMPLNKLSANETNGIRDKINELVGFSNFVEDFIQNPDLGASRFVTIGPITKVGNQVTVGTGYAWILNIGEYSNTEEFVFNIALETAGYNRKDIIVANTSNGFELIQGISSLGANTAVQPITPPDKLLLTVIDIFGTTTGSPEPPINGSLYVDKEFYSIQTLDGSGVFNTVNIDPKRGGLAVTGSISEVGGLSKNSQNYIIGQPFWVGNFKTSTLRLKHLNASSNWKFFFPGGLDIVLNPGEVAPFVLSEFGLLRYVGKRPKRWTAFRFSFVAIFAANTSWVSYNRSDSVTAITSLTADTYNNTTRVIANYRTPSFEIPFDCRIKRIYWNSGTLGTGSTLTINVHTWDVDPVTSSSINNLTVGSKTFPVDTGGISYEYTGAEIDLTSIITKGKRISVVMFNNNTAVGQLRNNTVNIEIEEL